MAAVRSWLTALHLRREIPVHAHQPLRPRPSGHAASGAAIRSRFRGVRRVRGLPSSVAMGLGGSLIAAAGAGYRGHQEAERTGHFQFR